MTVNKWEPNSRSNNLGTAFGGGPEFWYLLPIFVYILANNSVLPFAKIMNKDM